METDAPRRVTLPMSDTYKTLNNQQGIANIQVYGIHSC
jgi:hypothetical protein